MGSLVPLISMLASVTRFYMQLVTLKFKFIFFSYDVICRYWPYKDKVAEAFRNELPEILLLMLMRDHLSPFHGKTHFSLCQVGLS